MLRLTLLCGIVLFFSLRAAAVAQTAAPDVSLSPQEIFTRAVQRWESYPVPPYEVEVFEWAVSPENDAATRVTRLRDARRTADELLNVTRYPSLGKGLPDAIIEPASIGPARPLLAKDAEPPSPVDVPGVPNLKTIASVVAYRPQYAIDIVGTELIAGRPAYHLRLRPYGDPIVHALRDLWADVATFDVWKVHFVGSCKFCSPGTDMTDDYMPASGSWIWKDSHFVAGCGTTSEHCSYDIRRLAIVFAPSLPYWLFDEKLYREHQRAREPDYLATLLHFP
jgi:hypothetical protein